jgi:chromosomal replication initiation ATPase DnaA
MLGTWAKGAILMILVRDIIAETARRHRIPVEAMRTMTRRPEHAHPRHMAMLLARKMTGKHYTTIGGIFSRDHSSVINGCRQARRRCLADRQHLKMLCEIRAKVLAGTTFVPVPFSCSSRGIS